MESAHAEAAILLIEAGADRSRVNILVVMIVQCLTKFFRITMISRCQKKWMVSEGKNRKEQRNMSFLDVGLRRDVTQL